MGITLPQSLLRIYKGRQAEVTCNIFSWQSSVTTISVSNEWYHVTMH